MNSSKPSSVSTFPLNAWYAAAYDVELINKLLPRTICKQKVVMFRKTDGTVAVLEDACWHRLMPLSMGHLQGDELTCGYHGLVYNAQGRCVHMPSQETLNPLGLRAQLSGGGAAPLCLDLARRSSQG